MSLPVVKNTWQRSLNNVVGADGTQIVNGGTADRRELMFGIVSKMIDGGTFTVPWTVHSSCDVSAASLGNNWLTVADVFWNTSGGARSWIVLENSALGIFFLIDLEQGAAQDGSTLEAYIAKTAFSGGTTTARPTSVDEMHFIGGGTGSSESSAWGAASEAGSSVAHAWVYHVQMTNDGLSTQVLIWYNNIPIGTWIFELPDGSPTEWTNGAVCLTLCDTSEILNPCQTSEFLENSSAYNMLMFHSPRLTSGSGGTSRDAKVAPCLASIRSDLDGFSGPVLATGAHPITGDHIAYPVFWNTNAPSIRGLYGRARDLWMVADAAGVLGDTAPVASPQYFRHGSILVTWDGVTVPILA